MADRIHDAQRGEPGGIFGLLVLIEGPHRGALEYDFRARFPGIPRGLSAVGKSVSWGEALRLVKILRGDTTSQTAAALEGWDFPIDRATLATLDLFDVTVMANSDGKKGRPKPHPGRPMPQDTKSHKKMGNVGGRSRDEVEAILSRYARGAAV